MVDNEKKLTFIEHFGVLRKSFIRIVIFLIVFFIPCFYFRDILMDLSLHPILETLPKDSKIIFSKPTEGLATNIKLAFLTSIVLTTPLIIYEIWSFIKPALYENERYFSAIIIFLGTSLFLLGSFFCFLFVAPVAFNILLNEYTTEVITAFPNISETIGFLSSLILSFGIIFEYPLIIYLLSKLGFTSANFLASKRKYAVLICTICSAILTPTTDVISMMFMLIPLLVFYEIGVVIAKITRKRN